MGYRYFVTPIEVTLATADLLEALRLLVEIPPRDSTDDANRRWSYDYTEYKGVHSLVPTVLLAIHETVPDASLRIDAAGDDQDDVSVYRLESGVLRRFHATSWTTDPAQAAADPRYETTHSNEEDEEVETRVSAWDGEALTLEPGDLARRVLRQVNSYHYDGLVPRNDDSTQMERLMGSLARIEYPGGAPRNPKAVPIRDLLRQYDARFRLGALGTPLPQDPQGNVLDLVLKLVDPLADARHRSIADAYEGRRRTLARFSIPTPPTAEEFLAQGFKRG